MRRAGAGLGGETRRAAALCACAALSGCVAAAIPIVAGGAMTQSVAVSGESAPAASVASPAQTDPVQSGLTAQRTNLTALPAPSEADMAAAAQRRIAARSFDALYGYVLAQAGTDPAEAPMRSALLENPASLEPVRQNCGARPPLVLVDLDPAAARFDPAADGVANPALAEVVAVLRSRGIAIGWISAQAAAQAVPIRERLAQTGLDPNRADRLLLTNAAAPTKQALRGAIAASACPIAIAGDEPADFDELYAYLKAPDAALGLTEMYGAGWFLTPLPIE